MDCSTSPLIRTLYCRVLSKEVSSTIFKVFGMTWPGIETKSPNEPVLKVLILQIQVHLRVIRINVYSLDLQKWNLTIRYSLLSYPKLSFFLSVVRFLCRRYSKGILSPHWHGFGKYKDLCHEERWPAEWVTTGLLYIIALACARSRNGLIRERVGVMERERERERDRCLIITLTKCPVYCIFLHELFSALL